MGGEAVEGEREMERGGKGDRKQMEKNTAEIVHKKIKNRTPASRRKREWETRKLWGVGMGGAALENTKFPSLKPYFLTG